MRVHYTRYWTLTRGAGCVAQAPGGWTRGGRARAGTLLVQARFSLARALGAVGSLPRLSGRRRARPAPRRQRGASA